MIYSKDKNKKRRVRVVAYTGRAFCGYKRQEQKQLMKRCRLSLFILAATLTFTACENADDDKLPKKPSTEESGDISNTNKNSTTVYPDAGRLEFPKLKDYTN